LKEYVKKYGLLHFLGLGSAGIYGALSIESQQVEEVTLTSFFLSWIALCGILLVAAFALRKKVLNLSLPSILFWALSFRLFGVLASPLLSEDDYYRFLWDGYRFAETGDPYRDIPADFFGETAVPEPLSEIVYDINYPYLPTIYGPVMEVIFLASYHIAPGNLMVLKVFFVLFEGLLLFLLSRLLSMRWFLFAAWCPLLIFETSFQAHPDVIGISLMVCAFFAAKKGHPWMAMLALGLASSAKVFAVLIWPFIVKKETWFRQGCLMAAVIGLAYLPFIGHQGDAGSTSLHAMATDWEFNSAVYALFTLFNEEYARLLSLGSFFIIYVLLLVQFWKKKANNLSEKIPLDLVFGSFFLLSPVINAWYLLWLLPFSLMTPRWWSLAALSVVVLSYTTGLNLGSSELNDFEIPVNILILEFGVILAALCIDIRSVYFAKV